MHRFENFSFPITLIIVLLLSFSCNAFAGTIQLIAVQMKLDINDFYSQQSFEEKIKNLMKEVDKKRNPEFPALVVFPEDVGLMLLAQDQKETLNDVATIEEAIKKMTMKYFLPACWYRLKYKISWVPALYYYHNNIIAKTYFDTFSIMAREHQVYLVAGSTLLPHYQIDDGQVFYQENPLGPEIYNTSYLFGPDGKVIGYQDKVYLLEIEREEGLHLTPGNIEDIEVFHTEIGSLGIAVCLDAFKEDVVSRLRDQQADILIQPSANSKLWDRQQQEEWLESSHKYTYRLKYFKYAVNPMMNGQLFNLSFFGQSSIISNEEKSSGKDFMDLQPQGGFLKISGSDDKEEILVAEVEL